MASKTNSEIIRLFTSQRHQLQLNEDVVIMKNALKVIHTRKERIEAKMARQGIVQVKQKDFNKEIEKSEKYKSMDDHSIPLEEFYQRYKTDPKSGLTQEEANRRLQAQGLNKLSQKKKTHWLIQYLWRMTAFFSLLIWGGAILCFIAFGLSPEDPSNLYLGLVLVAVVLIGNTIEYIQNRKSSDLMESFKNFQPPETIVIRNGVERVIESQRIVRGDIIKVENGKKIPADLRIIQSNGMKVDNSTLTGQPLLQARTSECTHKNNPLESKNIAFFSTMNKEGSGYGVVMFVGDNTFIGQIAGLAASSPEQPTPLEKQIDRFVFRLGLFAIAIGIIVLVVGIAIGFPIIVALTLAIGITVANVPNGLLIEVTMSLTLTAKILAKKKVLAKNLQAVETLGSTTCICSDKTGTLTLNKMTAANLWYEGKVYVAANKQKQGKNYKYEYNTEDPSFKALQQTAVVCSTANFDLSAPQMPIIKIREDQSLSNQQKQRLVKQYMQEWNRKLQNTSIFDLPTIGDASQSGLIKFFQPIQELKVTRDKYPVLLNRQNRQYRLLFDSKNKFAYTLNNYPNAQENSEVCLFTKGAPQKIWKMCTHIISNGKRVPKNQQWNKKFEQANLYFGKNGERVLGFAKLHLDKKTYHLKYDFNIDDPQKANFPLFQQTFVGMISLNDPPRDAVPFSVTTCQAAGVKVIMVTGDQPVTAAAIARKCNIIRSQETVNEIAEREGISLDQAFFKSKSIVIHGDLITKMTLDDQGKPEREQGKLLQKWLSKQQIVFARTSPAQKLIIVKACQRLGHIVAVTGDGVNDSPAIKKADLGIAMGVAGTDVAKDAASMILLTDDFSAIVVAMEQGRRTFQNLKKAIAYVMSSQISQIAPFIGLLIIQFPPPITTVILLCIDLGTDLIPAVSYAYQSSQIGIMTRKPRSSQDHLVNMKLMAHGYGWVGWSSFWLSLISFYIVMIDFGFRGDDLFFKNATFKYQVGSSDTYNPTDYYYGNSVLREYIEVKMLKSCSQVNAEKRQLIDWIFAKRSSDDLRLTALKCVDTGNVQKPVFFQQIFKWGECRVQQISPITNKPVCFTSQAAKYAQSAYFYANVVTQVFNLFMCKTRRQSSLSQGLGNQVGYFGLTTQIILTFCLAYISPLNVVFGTRDNIYIHFGVIALPLSALLLTMQEFRKYLIRNLPADEKGKPNWFYRNVYW